MTDYDPAWTIVREGVMPEREGAHHTIFAVGNGSLGIRGDLAELPLGGSPAIYLAGFYDELVVPPANPDNWTPYMAYWSVRELAGQVEHKPCIVNCPNFLDVSWQLDREKMLFTEGRLKALVRRLDLRQGVFTAEAHWVSPGGKELRYRQMRFADLADPRRAFVRYEIEPVNFAGTVTVRAGIDAATEYVTYPALEDHARMYEPAELGAAGDCGVCALVRGRHRGATAAFATGLRTPGRNVRYSVLGGERRIDLVAETRLEQGCPFVLERIGAAASGHRHERPLDEVRQCLADSGATGFDAALAGSREAWDRDWAHSDVGIEGSVEDQVAARFSIYNLLIAASRDDEHVSIPVKSLTGGGYRGLVYWDTDIYMTPMLNFTQPRLARNLASFRYHTLAGARGKAARLGCRGAAYPWSTDPAGAECETVWSRNITHQHHVTSDVAYAIRQYLDCSEDSGFYADRAAEVFVETARFWVSRAVEREDGALGIPGASGADEYHCVCDDNAAILHMAAWNLRVAADAVAHLQRHAPDRLAELRGRTGLTDEEIVAFGDSPSCFRTMQRADGVFEQCQGFFALEDRVEPNRGHGDYPHLTQTLRQPDVLMLFYLLPGRWPREVVRANWDYYEPRTIHASSLSHPVHGVIAAELGLEDKAREYLSQCLGMDLKDEMSNAHLGAHMATHGMTWVALVRGFGGTWPVGGRVRVEPHLPAGWTRLRFRLKWRGADFVVDIRPERIEVTNLPDATAALPATVLGAEHTVGPGETVCETRRART